MRANFYCVRTWLQVLGGILAHFARFSASRKRLSRSKKKRFLRWRNGTLTYRSMSKLRLWDGFLARSGSLLTESLKTFSFASRSFVKTEVLSPALLFIHLSTYAECFFSPWLILQDCIILLQGLHKFLVFRIKRFCVSNLMKVDEGLALAFLFQKRITRAS